MCGRYKLEREDARKKSPRLLFEAPAFQVSPEIDEIYEGTFFRKIGTSFAPALLRSGHLKKRTIE